MAENGWAGGMSSLLSWPSPMRQPRNIRVLTGSRAVLTLLCCLPWALGSALAATAPPAPRSPPALGVCVPRGGGISPIGPFHFLSRSMLLLPCLLPLTCPLAVCLRLSFSPPPEEPPVLRLRGGGVQ
jgi:hypothetical protein